MKNSILFVSIIIALLTASCEDFFISEVEPPEGLKEQKLVVHSYISPQADSVEVSVTLSKPIFGAENQGDVYVLVNDAQVVLKNMSTQQSIRLPYHAERGRFMVSKADFPVVAGETYILDVSDSEGRQTSATCHVPKNISGEIENIQYKMKVSELEKSSQITFEFTDNADETNFYNAIAKLKYRMPDSDSLNMLTYSFDLFSDLNQNGEKIIVKSNEHYVFFGYQTNAAIEPVEAEVILYSIDKNYYDYERTRRAQLNAEDMGPFAEPVVITSNIANGIGVFCAYTKSSAVRLF